MKIGELASRVGVTTKTIRFYESIGLLADPPRTPSGYRKYGEGDTERLAFIRTAQRLGLSLEEIGDIFALRDRGQQPCGYVAEVLRRQICELEARIEELSRRRDALRALHARATLAPDHGTYCGVIEHAIVSLDRPDPAPLRPTRSQVQRAGLARGNGTSPEAPQATGSEMA